MKYNIENLYKNKFQDLEIEPHKNSWNKINKKLKRAKYVKNILTVVSVAAILSFASILLFSDKNKNQEITNPQKSEIVISNDKNFIKNNSQNDNDYKNESHNNKINNNTANNQKVINGVTVQRYINTTSDSSKNLSVVDSNKTYKGFYLSSNSGCAPLTIVLENKENSNQLNWTINNKEYSNKNRLVLTLTESDDYDILLKRNDNGKLNSYSDNVTVYPRPSANFEINNNIIINEEIIIENYSEGADSYKWLINGKKISTSENLVYKFINSGVFDITLIAFNKYDCSDTIRKEVNVDEPTKSIVFPTAFSPNIYGPNGGYYKNYTEKNKIFHGYVFGKTVESFNMKIYNRQGKILFQTNNFNVGWDGYYQNKLVPIGVYIYIVKGQFTDGESFQEQGSVTVIYDKN